MALPVFLAAIAASFVALPLLPPIVQPQSYHRFADQRALSSIPNAWNIVSNLPFIAIGAAGLLRWPDNAVSVIIFAGILLTGFGSTYYHWSPSDGTLFWDRLPMTIVFMAILAGTIEERMNVKAGKMLLWPLLAIGVSSVLLWRATGDLRLYAWVQFFPCLALPLIFWLLAPKFTGTSYWIAAGGLYILARCLNIPTPQSIRSGTW